MDFLALQTRLIERLDESATPTYWTLAEVKEALNKSVRFFALLTLCVERQASFNLSAATAFYAISSQLTDFLVPLRVTTSAGARLLPYKLHELNMESDTWRSTPGTPTKYAQAGYDLLAISGQPAGGGTSLLIRYAAAPATLSGNTDAPEIPEEQHPCLIDYALYWLRLKEGGQELAKTLPHLGMFLDVAEKYGEFVRAKSKGQLYDAMPFDLKSFDRSRLMKLVLANQKGTRKN
jgi:hypothetical protein